MSKSKTLFTSLIGLLGVIALLLSFLIYPTQRTQALESNTDGIDQKSTLVFDNKAGNSVVETQWRMSETSKSFTFDLFTGATNADNIPYFEMATYKDTWNLTWGTSLSTSFDANTKTFTYSKWATSDASKREGYIKSNFSISSSLQKAGQNGYLSISAFAEFGSKSKDRLIGSDYPADNVTMTLRNESIGEEQSTTAQNINGYTSETFTFNNIQDENYSLKFSVTRGGGSDIIMNVRAPTITLTTTDITFPTYTDFVTQNADVYTQSKNVTFTVADSEAGIDRVEVNGVEASLNFADSTQHSATATFVVDQNDIDYVVRIYDNVGNVTETVYHSSFIDTTAPELIINNLDGVTFDDFVINFTASQNSGTMQSDETFYYTVDGTSPVDSETRAILNIGLNTLNFAENGEYTLRVYGIDAAGNSAEYSYTFTINGTYYYKITAEFRGNSPETLVIDSKEGATNAEVSYVIEQTKEQNGIKYAFYKATINGVAVEGDTISFNFDKTYNINIIYREIVDVEAITEYSYTGAVIPLDYTASCAEELVNWTITKDGLAGELRTRGQYSASYSVDTENFCGSGSFEITIYQPVEFVLNESEYIYSIDGFALDFNLSVEIGYSLKFVDNAGKTYDYLEVLDNSLNVGKYTFVLTITDDFYYFDEKALGNNEITGEFSISQCPVLLDEYNVTVTYSGENFEFENPYLYSVSAIFKQNGEVVTPRNAGVYDVEITITDSNYVGSTSGSLEIEKATLTVTADDKTSVYGDSTSPLTVSINGMLGQDEFKFEAVCDLGKNIGEYTISVVKQELANYNVNYVDGKYNITPKQVIVSVDTGQSKTFGDVDPEFTYTVEGLVSGDDLGVKLNREAGENAGTYAISLESYQNKNYSVTFRGDNFRINPVTLIVSADNVSKTFGEVDPDLTYSILYGEIVNGSQPEITLVREAGENAGRYAITLEGSANSNYEIVFMSGYLTINKATVEISALPSEKAYGALEPSFTFTGGDGIEFSGALSRELGESVGEYEITLGTLSNPNYNIVFNSAKFTINKADIVITANNSSKIYGANDPTLSYTVERVTVVDGEIIARETITDTALNISLTREAGENAGTYAILLDEFNSENYVLYAFNNGVFKIEPKTVYVYFDNVTKTYGSVDPSYTYTLDGVIKGENLAINVTREEGENVGEYRLSATTENANYTLVFAPATLTIEKASVKLNVSDVDTVYDGTEKNINVQFSLDEELTYRITLNGEVVASAINAGTYQVTVSFAGNENYNAVASTATLTIRKADAQVSILRNIFVANGNVQNPEIESALAYTIVYDDPASVANVGEHGYTIVFNDTNYNSVRGTLTILDKPANATSGGSVEFESGNVDNSDVELSIDKTEDKDNAQSAVNDNVDLTYEIKYNQSSNATVKVELDYVADDYSNIYVYMYNDKGEAKILPYQVVDGKIVFSVPADNLKLAIVKQVTGISIVSIGIFVILAGIVALIVVRKHMKRKKIAMIKIS